MLIPSGPAGQYGVISDVNPTEIPMNAWSASENMRFPEGYAEKIGGYRSLWNGAEVSPYFLATVRPLTGEAFWVYAGAEKVYAYDSAHNEITRVSGLYTSNAWQGGVMNGLLYLNNGVDKPQVWSPANNTQKLIDLPNWPATARAATIRSFKNFMVALDVTKASTRDPRLVKWSHPAPVGTYPVSWDETDPTKDAGEYSLSESEGVNIDCIPLRSVNVIYKDDSIWAMAYVGGNDIFAFDNLFRNVGIMAKDCAVEFQKGKHLVFARDDVIIHDGQTIEPILRAKMRRRIYNSINSVHTDNSFVTINPANQEAWICWPENGHVYPNKALIWNWRSNTTGVRDIPEVASIGLGIADISAGDDNWNSDETIWDESSAEWGQSTANPSQTRLVMATPEGDHLHGIVPDVNNFNGTDFTAKLERTGIGIPFRENLPPDFGSKKYCTEIWPRITGTIGGIVQIRIGAHDTFHEEPKWGEWKNYVIGTTQKINVTTGGRLLAISFQSTTAISWKLHGYSLEVIPIGEY